MIDLKKKAQAIRKLTLDIVLKARASHIGSSFSCIEILTLLYTKYLKNNNMEDVLRDRLLISKGHIAAGYYAVLSYFNYIDKNELETYCQNGSNLMGHVSHYVNGVEFSSGSLGHCLPIACGTALVGKRENHSYHTYVLLSDGEINEGSNWEAFLFAPHHNLNNLTVIIDYNKLQAFGYTNEVLELEPLEAKFKAFNWETYQVDGHSFDELQQALEAPSNAPKVIIAHTIKGMGVSFMQNNLAWHYKSPNEHEYEIAKREICEQLL
jgi:transketolase